MRAILLLTRKQVEQIKEGTLATVGQRDVLLTDVPAIGIFQ